MIYEFSFWVEFADGMGVVRSQVACDPNELNQFIRTEVEAMGDQRRSPVTIFNVLTHRVRVSHDDGQKYLPPPHVASIARAIGPRSAA